MQVIVDLTQERDYLSSQQTLEMCRNLSMSSPERPLISGACLSNGGGSLSSSGLSKEERQHLSVELADTKAKLRRYRQELYVFDFSAVALSTQPVNRVFSHCNPVKSKISTGALWTADYQNTARIIFSESVLVVKEGDVSTGQPIIGGLWF